jgi:hypothetical protein
VLCSKSRIIATLMNAEVMIVNTKDKMD